VTLKMFLVLMTVIAVISDSLLHPFYPQYLSAVFGVADPERVGQYIAACGLMVLAFFPLWALVAKKIPVLRLLIATQLAAAALSLACARSTSLVVFWFLSLAMMIAKASYLLIYPYVMSLEEKKEHMGTISLLAFVVYFGNILAAFLSGFLFEWFDPRMLFVVMAAGDLVQVALCLYLLVRPARTAIVEPHREPPAAPEASLSPRFISKLGAVMFVLYFSAYMTEPFFARYWEGVVASDNKIFSGAVFAIPGVAALAGLYVNAFAPQRTGAYGGIAPAILLAIAGLWLEVSARKYLVLAGRFLYGWALFQTMVRLDLLLFRLGRPETYAVDFSKLNFFQGLGVLVASVTAGRLVASFGVRVPFVVAVLGFLVGVLLYWALFREELRGAAKDTVAPGVAVKSGAVS
jgi:MFS transporter, DHA1 family, multidrug resistance protein